MAPSSVPLGPFTKVHITVTATLLLLLYLLMLLPITSIIAAFRTDNVVKKGLVNNNKVLKLHAIT